MTARACSAPPLQASGPVVIRPADKTADFPAILEGAAAFAEEAQMMPFLPETFAEFRAVVQTVISLPCIEVLLAVDAAGACLGGMGFSVLPYTWNPRVTLGEELFLWVRPAAPPTVALRLIRAGQDAMRARGVQLQAWAAMATSPPKIAQVYARMGLAAMQSNFVGVLSR